MRWSRWRRPTFVFVSRSSTATIAKRGPRPRPSEQATQEVFHYGVFIMFNVQDQVSPRRHGQWEVWRKHEGWGSLIAQTRAGKRSGKVRGSRRASAEIAASYQAHFLLGRRKSTVLFNCNNTHWHRRGALFTRTHRIARMSACPRAHSSTKNKKQ